MGITKGEESGRERLRDIDSRRDSCRCQGSESVECKTEETNTREHSGKKVQFIKIVV